MQPESDPQQLVLLDEVSVSNAKGAENAEAFTASTFERQRPGSYDLVCTYLAAGVSMRKIAEVIGCSTNTVLAVKRKAAEKIESHKKRLAGSFSVLASLSVESAIEDLSNPSRAAEIPFRDKGIVAGIAAEKAELLNGGATTRTEVVSVSFSAADLAALMGCGAEKEGEKGGWVEVEVRPPNSLPAPKNPLPEPPAGPNPGSPQKEGAVDL
jgi:hypothetical protein